MKINKLLYLYVMTNINFDSTVLQISSRILLISVIFIGITVKHTITYSLPQPARLLYVS